MEDQALSRNFLSAIFGIFGIFLVEICGRNFFHRNFFDRKNSRLKKYFFEKYFFETEKFSYEKVNEKWKFRKKLQKIFL